MASAGYTYGIEGVSKNSTAQNFVVNQGSDAQPIISADELTLQGVVAASITAPLIGVEAAALLQVDALVINLNGVVNAATLSTDAIYLRAVSVAAAAPTVCIDFSAERFTTAFPSGSYCYAEVGDGVGSSCSGFFVVGAGGTLSGLQQTQGALLAPVTAAALSIATSVLSVTFTGKAATTNAIVRLTRCNI